MSRHIRLLEAHEGCKVGVVVAFENIEEAKALVAAKKAEEVRFNGTEWVAVTRHEATVVDSITLSGT